MSTLIPQEKRGQCSDDALRCHGTAYIFEKRAAPIRLWLRVLSFSGIAVPASVGALVTTYNFAPSAFQSVAFVAGLLGITQLIVSIWALVASWDENLAYYIESKGDNYRLADAFSRLAKSTSVTVEQFEIQLTALNAQSEARALLDNRFDVSDDEKRKGMRAGLFKFQRACVACHQTPKSLVPTNCDVCGNF